MFKYQALLTPLFLAVISAALASAQYRGDFSTIEIGPGGDAIHNLCFSEHRYSRRRS